MVKDTIYLSASFVPYKDWDDYPDELKLFEYDEEDKNDIAYRKTIEPLIRYAMKRISKLACCVAETSHSSLEIRKYLVKSLRAYFSAYEWKDSIVVISSETELRKAIEDKRAGNRQVCSRIWIEKNTTGYEGYVWGA